MLAFEGWFHIGSAGEQSERNRGAHEFSLAAALIEIRDGRPSGLKVTMPQFMPNSPSEAMRVDTRHDPEALGTAQSIRSSPDWERKFTWEIQSAKLSREKPSRGEDNVRDALWFVVALAVIVVVMLGLGGRLGSAGEEVGKVGLFAFFGLILYGSWRGFKDGR